MTGTALPRRAPVGSIAKEDAQIAGQAVRTVHVPTWAQAYLTATAEQRQRWLELAQQNDGWLLAAPGESAGVPAALPPASTAVLDLLEASEWPTPELRPDEEAAFPNLSATQALCLNRILANRDLFLLQGLPCTGLDRVVETLIETSLARGERILLCFGTELGDTALVARCAQLPGCWAVLLGEANKADEALTSLRPAERVTSFIARMREHWRAEGAAQEDRKVMYRSRLSEISDWRKTADSLGELQERLSSIDVTLTNVRDALTQDINAGRVDQRAEWWQQREAEERRHQESLVKLETTLAQKKNDYLTAEAELRKWQADFTEQAALVAAKRIPNPFSPRWWRAIFQGRSAQRLEEFRARVQDAEIEHLSARSQLQMAEEQIEIEQRRHDAAEKVILEGELARRRTLVEGERTKIQQEIARILENWHAWLLPAERTELAATTPNRELLNRLETAWSEQLAAIERGGEVPARELPDDASFQAEAQAFLPWLANLIAVEESELTRLRGEDAAWFQPGFDRIIILGTGEMGESTIKCLASWGRQLVLVAPLPFADASVHQTFTRLWTLARPPASDAPMRWLRDAETWHCLWTGLSAEMENHLHREPLVDEQEIELFIVSPPDAAPRLAGLTFAAKRYTLAEAKQFHAKEIAEWMIDPLDSEYRLREEGGRLIVEYCQPVAEPLQPIPYPNGVTEWIVDAGATAGSDASHQSWRTKQLDFTTSASWNWELVRDWLAKHAFLADGTRSFRLTEADGPGGRLIEALQWLHPEATHLYSPQPDGTVGDGGVVWLPPTVEARTVRPAGMQRMESPRGSTGNKPTAAFNVNEAKALVRGLLTTIQSKSNNSAADTSVLLLARSEAQRQLLQRSWHGLGEDAPHLARLNFATLGDACGGTFDFIGVSLWPEAANLSLEPSRVHETLSWLLRRARCGVLVAGDLNSLIPLDRWRGVDLNPVERELMERLADFRAFLEATAFRDDEAPPSDQP